MIKRQDIVNEALTWCGTPWHHHQGKKGVGTDCVQFVYGVGKQIGFIPQDTVIENYEPLARGSFLVRHLERWLEKTNEIRKGTVLLIASNGLMTHVGIVVDNFSFVHASASHCAVVVSPIHRYESFIRAYYDVPGVVD